MADPFLALPAAARLAGTLDASLITRGNAPDLPGARISALSAVQFAALDALIIAEFTPVQSDSWEPEQLGAMTAGQGAQIDPDQLARFTAARLGQLSPAAFGGLSDDCLRGLTTVQLAGLTKDQGKKLTAAKIAALTVPRFASVSANAFSGIPCEILGGLPEGRIREITEAQTALMSALQLRFFHYSKIPFLSGPALRGIPHALFVDLNFSLNQAGAIIAAQAPFITANQFATISATRFARLVPGVIRDITDGHFAGLTAAQAGAMTPDQGAQLNLAKVNAIRGFPTAPSPMAAIPGPTFRRIPIGAVVSMPAAARHLETCLAGQGVGDNVARLVVAPHGGTGDHIRVTATTGNAIRWIKIYWSQGGHSLHIHFTAGTNNINTAQHKIRPEPWNNVAANYCPVNALPTLAGDIALIRQTAINHG